jgi:cytidyltransferase-like protein
MSAPASVAEAIRDRGASVFVIATGAGAGLQNLLWQAPGISRILVGAAFPYASGETDELLGFRPASYSTRATAVELATAAFLRAKAADGAKPALGLAITASVASQVAHRGDHRIHAAAVGDAGCWTWDRVLAKGVGAQARLADGLNADQLGLDLLAHALLGRPAGGAGGEDGPQRADDLVAELFWQRPLFLPDGRRLGHLAPGAALLFPGTFNPLHDGHRAMARQAQALAGKSVVYAVNADSRHKPALGVLDLLARAAALRAEKWQDGGGHPLLFTRGEPLFVDKAKARPGATFVVGADALARMLEPQWGVDPREVLALLAAHQARFYVFGREEAGRMLTVDAVLSALPFPADEYRPLFEQVEGRWAASSSELRRRTLAGGGR